MENYYFKKSIWKWILLYIIIGAVAYGLIYYFFFYKKGGYNDNSQYPISNSQNKMADWKTYRNDEYGFEIKYPNDWEVQKDLYSKFIVKTVSGNTANPNLIIEFLSEEYSSALAREKKDPYDTMNDVIISGAGAKEFLYYSPIGATSQTIIISKNNLVVKISSLKNSSLDPILSTFKFTK